MDCGTQRDAYLYPIANEHIISNADCYGKPQPISDPHNLSDTNPYTGTHRNVHYPALTPGGDASDLP